MADFDFRFAWEGAAGPGGPWAQLLVVKFEGREEISHLYRYTVTLLAKTPAAPVTAAELIGKRATLRIATLSSPGFKVVHGVIAEARDGAQLPDGNLLEVTLVPPWERARHRRRSRIFLSKSPRQIIETVLKEEPLLSLSDGGSVVPDAGEMIFTPAAEHFTWRVTDARRLDDTRVRGYCVQYRESDHDFVARLLEEEGISYHFENGAEQCLLVLTDRDTGRIPLDVPLSIPGIPGHEVKSMHLGARLRTIGVELGDYNWKKPELAMQAEAGAGELWEVAYPGNYPDSPAQGASLAEARADRFGTEARFATGEGSIRLLSAATLFQIEGAKPRYDGAYLVTALRVKGEQQGVASIPGDMSMGVPFYAWFEVIRRGKGAKVEESRFRPARSTPRPHIVGTQTAFVTAEPQASAEVNVGGPDGLSIGCVRVKFHWDDETSRHAKEPTSCWIRVSQVFAGAGQGAVWHPRVGVEVIVDFDEGNPDRPIIVGRVYNGTNLPPYGGSPVHSTYKSFSTPGGGQWNEVTFNDTAGSELVFMNAGKDMTVIVANDRLEAIGSNATMTVGVNDDETVGANETITVGANDTLKVGANDTLSIGANSSTDVGANDTLTVGANQTKKVDASQTILVDGTLTETVSGDVTETYEAARDTSVAGAVTETLDATRETTVGGANKQTYDAGQILLDGGDREITVDGSLTTHVTGTSVQITAGAHETEVEGPVTSNVGAAMIYISPKYDLSTPKGEELDDTCLEIDVLSGEAVGLELAATDVSIALTGVKLSYTVFELELHPIKMKIHAIKMAGLAIQVHMVVTWMHLKGFTCIT